MESDIKKELSQKIKGERQRLGISQAELARKLDVNSTGTVGNWESGASSPDYQNLCFLADLFGVSTDYLLGRDKNRSPYQKKESGDESGDEASYKDFYEEYIEIIKKYEGCDEIGRDSIESCIDHHYKRCTEDAWNPQNDKKGKRSSGKKVHSGIQKLFLEAGKDPEYDEIAKRVQSLKALKRKSKKSYYDITNFLWHAGYGDTISLAYVMSIFGVKAFGTRVPCEQLCNDIEAYLMNKYVYTAMPHNQK